MGVFAKLLQLFASKKKGEIKRTNLKSRFTLEGRVFGEVRPACTVEVVGLTDPRMLIEIEVTALRRRGATRAGAKARGKSRAGSAKSAATRARRKK